ncbi:MAG: glycosyltransferase [Chloroflexota bacterium]
MLYVILALYTLVVGLLFIYGLNFLWLSVVSVVRKDAPVLPELVDYPHVAVQLPIYNERYVAERLIRAAADLTWPRDRLEVQVLDDSSDDTVQIAEQVCRDLSLNGVWVRHIRRGDRAGFKAGALAHGMASTEAPYLAVFDADFVPPADFLVRTMAGFLAKDVGFVQTRWGHLNARYSLFTFLQALAIDAHFLVEQQARSATGAFFNFNGTAGIWRRQAVESGGGWQADTLTEDLDLSYRVQLAGWRGLFLRDVVAPAELPVTMVAFRRQQHRWAKGSIECAVKLAPRLLRAPLPLAKKVQALLHLTGYGIHLLMFLLIFLYSRKASSGERLICTDLLIIIRFSPGIVWTFIVVTPRTV